MRELAAVPMAYRSPSFPATMDSIVRPMVAPTGRLRARRWRLSVISRGRLGRFAGTTKCGEPLGIRGAEVPHPSVVTLHKHQYVAYEVPHHDRRGGRGKTTCRAIPAFY